MWVDVVVALFVVGLKHTVWVGGQVLGFVLTMRLFDTVVCVDSVG